MYKSENAELLDRAENANLLGTILLKNKDPDLGEGVQTEDSVQHFRLVLPLKGNKVYLAEDCIC